MNSSLKLRERQKVVTLRLQGLTYKAIKQSTGKDKKYVKRWIKRWNETGSIKDAPHSGRKSKFSNTLKKKVTSLLKSKKGCTVRNTSKFLRNHSEDISKSSVHRIAKQLGMRNVRPIKKPFLTEAHKKKRVTFATSQK